MFNVNEAGIMQDLRAVAAGHADACVYTVLLGGYEQLNEQPVAAGSSLRFICLTDDPELRSESWEIRLVEPVFARDPIRSQRDLKIRSHLYLPEFARSVYIDNSVLLTVAPEILLDIAAKEPDGIVMPRHSFRETVLDEFLEVARLGFDDNTRIFEQLNHYLLSRPEVLEEHPWWTAIMVRDHRSVPLRAALEMWALHVMRYSRRDQLSVNMALKLAGIRPAQLQIDNFASDLHSWPHTAGRDRARGERNLERSMMPLVARLRAAETAATASADQATRLEDLLRAAEAERQAILNSTSWRITAPLRRAARLSPRLTCLLRDAVRLIWRALPRGRPLLPAPIKVAKARPESVEGRPAVPSPARPAVLDRVLTRAGHWIYIDPTDERGRRLVAACGSLNPLSLLAWDLLLAEGGWTHVVDVGANYGEMLVNGSLPEGARIVAIEPNPAVRTRLEWTLRDAGLRVEILDVALSASEGAGALLVDTTWSGTTRLAQQGEVMTLPVRTTTLGAVLLASDTPPSAVRALVKIDVEGHEADVLRGVIGALPTLGTFAALVEVLHGTEEELAWMEQHFEVALLEPGVTPRLVLAPLGQLREMLASGRFYPQDVVLRRRGAAISSGT